VKTYVKRTIHNNIENKVWIDYGVNQSITTANTTTPTFENLILTPAVGTQQNQRIGNTLKIRSAVIRGHVNLLPYSLDNTSVAPQYIKMWIARSKRINTNDLAATTCSSTFFETGSGTTGFQGNMLDMELSNNKDEWTILQTRTIKVGVGSNNTTNYPVANVHAYDNSPFSAPFYFNYAKHLKKKLSYLDADVICKNSNLFLIFQPVYASGAATGLTVAEYHFNTRIEYEDA